MGRKSRYAKLLNKGVRIDEAQFQVYEGSGERTISIQLFKVGKFTHPEIGPFEFKKRDFQLFIKNFENRVHDVDLALNLNHKKEEAAGWIIELETRDDGRELWAIVELTAMGAEKIQEREFRYVSAEFHFLYRDNESGKTFERVVTGAALTNNPFIKGMEQVELSETKTLKHEAKPMNLKEMKIELSEHGIDLDALQRDAGTATGLATELSETKGKLKAVETKLSTVSGENAGLKTKCAEFESTAKIAQFAELKRKGMAEGKLTKVTADGFFKKSFDANGAEFCEAMLAEMPKVVHTDPSGHGGGEGGGEGGGNPEAQLQEAANKIMVESKCEFGEAFEAACAANPKLYAKYEAGVNA